ncbi:hypothetical protein ACJX0J_042279, partial [Zea mays]
IYLSFFVIPIYLSFFIIPKGMAHKIESQSHCHLTAIYQSHLTSWHNQILHIFDSSFTIKLQNKACHNHNAKTIHQVIFSFGDIAPLIAVAVPNKYKDENTVLPLSKGHKGHKTWHKSIYKIYMKIDGLAIALANSSLTSLNSCLVVACFSLAVACFRD